MLLEKKKISCKGSKVPYWQFFIYGKMALLNPCIKLNFFLAKGAVNVLGQYVLSNPYVVVHLLAPHGARQVNGMQHGEHRAVCAR
jgi:hypothetical protein